MREPNGIRVLRQDAALHWRSMLTSTLQRAVKRVSALPFRDQEAFARWILRELAEDTRWSRSHHRTRGRLREMARAALADHKAGRTIDFNPDRL